MCIAYRLQNYLLLVSHFSFHALFVIAKSFINGQGNDVTSPGKLKLASFTQLVRCSMAEIESEPVMMAEGSTSKEEDVDVVLAV